MQKEITEGVPQDKVADKVARLLRNGAKQVVVDRDDEKDTYTVTAVFP